LKENTMREFTKSTISAGLAMSLFGTQVVRSVLQGRSPSATPGAQERIESVTQALLENTGGSLRETFQAGDKVQRAFVDAAFRFMSLGSMRGTGASGMMIGAAQVAAERMRSWMSTDGTRPGGCGCAGTETWNRKPDAQPRRRDDSRSDGSRADSDPEAD
jgi:hypothetical protein